MKQLGWFGLFVGSALFVIGTTELAHDEAYYWLWSRHLAWGYFDHPPLIAWLISLSATWMGGEWGVRLAPFLAVVAAAWAVGRKIIPAERQWAWWGGWLIFPLLSIPPSFAVPDTALLAAALLFFWSLYLYVERDSWSRAVAVSVTAVLMLYAKYHGILLIAGTVIALPGLLKRRSFWLAVLLGCILLLPHLLWQWQHDFITSRYHLLEAHRGKLSWSGPLEFLIRQAAVPGILLAPWVWQRVWRGWRSSPFDRAFGGIALVTFSFFFFLSFVKKVEFNWTGAAYPTLLALALRVPGEWPLQRRWVRILGVCSVVLVIYAKVIMGIPAAQVWIKRLGEIHGWQDWSRGIARDTEHCELAANTLQIASKLSFYLGKEIPALNIGARANQFDIWRWEKRLHGKSVCWLTEDVYPGTEWVTPDGNILYLVRGITSKELLDLKASNR
jgi:4-amino-4-deoxy-L-arabinose transferase-like glycosyltransferase